MRRFTCDSIRVLTLTRTQDTRATHPVQMPTRVSSLARKTRANSGTLGSPVLRASWESRYAGSKFGCIWFEIEYDNFYTELFIDEVEKRVAILDMRSSNCSNRVIKRRLSRYYVKLRLRCFQTQATTQPLFPSPCLTDWFKSQRRNARKTQYLDAIENETHEWTRALITSSGQALRFTFPSSKRACAQLLIRALRRSVLFGEKLLFLIVWHLQK